MREPGGTVRPAYADFAGLLDDLSIASLVAKQAAAEELFRRLGITFAVYAEGGSTERLIPFDLIAGLHEIMLAIADDVTYTKGETHVHTTGAEALEQGRGVCQDHAHIFCAVCRSLGIPARLLPQASTTLRQVPYAACAAAAGLKP